MAATNKCLAVRFDEPEIVDLVAVAESSHPDIVIGRDDDDAPVGNVRVSEHARYPGGIDAGDQNSPEVECGGAIAKDVQRIGIGAAGGHLSRIDYPRPVAESCNDDRRIGEAFHAPVIDDEALRPDPDQAGRGFPGTEVVNAARIATAGDGAMGIAIGLDGSGFAAAEDDEIANRGIIETHGDGAAGVIMVGDGHHLTNSGRITTAGGVFDSADLGAVFRAAGVVVSGNEAVVGNTPSGVIESKNADSGAVELNFLERDGLPAVDMTSRLENFGLIKGADLAVLGGAGEETVINHGRIVGDVELGGGADTLVFGKGGVLAGELFLGGGDDTVVIENGSGATRVADFAAGVASGDVIDISAFFSSFSQLTAHSHQRGNDVIVALDHNDTLVIENMQLGTLNVHDFLFV